NENSTSELAMFQDIGAFQGQMNPLIDEIEIIKSRANMMEVVNKLQLNTRIFRLGNILDSELYRNAPFKLNFKESDSVLYKSGFSFYIDLVSESSFGYKKEENSPYKMNTFGSNIPTPLGDLVITPNTENIAKLKGSEYRVVINPVHRVADGYRDRIAINPIDRSSNILSLYLQDRIQQRAQDIINTLIETYN